MVATTISLMHMKTECRISNYCSEEASDKASKTVLINLRAAARPAAVPLHSEAGICRRSRAFAYRARYVRLQSGSMACVCSCATTKEQRVLVLATILFLAASLVNARKRIAHCFAGNDPSPAAVAKKVQISTSRCVTKLNGILVFGQTAKLALLSAIVRLKLCLCSGPGSIKRCVRRGRAKDSQRFFPPLASAVTREIRLQNGRHKAREQKIDNNAKRKKKRSETFSTSFITPHKSIFASTSEEPSFDTENSCIFRSLSVPFLNDSLHTARAVGASVCARPSAVCRALRIQ